MKTFIPKAYKSTLDLWETEHAIKLLKDTFQLEMSSMLKLRRITAPIIVKGGEGINDNLSGVEQPVHFENKYINSERIEIVQSLAKWKRYALYRHNIQVGMGIYTDMNAIRACEEPDNLHSLYVDQWDWEKVIDSTSLDLLYSTVKEIYSVIRGTQFLLSEQYPQLQLFLPENIKFIHSEELLKKYPNSTPSEREDKITEKYGAVFLRGIGGKLSDGSIHDDRAADYDDWSSKTPDGLFGLNGDILIWNPILKKAFEISSMGIRVSPDSLKRQLKIKGEEAKESLYFHKLLLDGKLPQTIGGGIGQSRLCMLLLQKCHIGEVQSSIWDDNTLNLCREKNVFLM